MNNYDKLISFCNENNIQVDNNKLNKLDSFYEMLIEKNKVMNLTGITEFSEVLDKHFIDSISIAILSEYVSREKKILDLGTGAGFPGIPLAIFYPKNEFVLVDSLNKRILFLQEVVNKLELNNVKLIHSRAEDLARTDNREQFDYCLSRAVANINTLSEYCLPFVKTGGYFISYKSGSIDEEISEIGKSISILGGQKKDVLYFDLPGTDIKRSFIIIEKIKSTPNKYPRKAGTPSKEPLK